MKYKVGQQVKVLVKVTDGTRRWIKGYVVGPKQMPPQREVCDIELNKKHWPIATPRGYGFYWVTEEGIK